MVRVPLRPLSTDDALNQIFYLKMNEVKDGMKWINENVKRHEEERLKREERSWGEIGKRENSKKEKQIPELSTTIVLLVTPRLELGTLVGTDVRSNHSYAEMAKNCHK